MDINIKGNPGTGNTFQEINIGMVENYNPNATTVINNHYGEKQKPAPAAEKVLQDAEREQLKADIMQYVAKIEGHVSADWNKRYETLWKNILNLPEVEAEVYNPGRQKGTTFNRNLIAHIIYIMCNQNVIVDKNAAQLAFDLEGDKDHSVRTQLGQGPDNKVIRDKVLHLIHPE